MPTYRLLNNSDGKLIYNITQSALNSIFLLIKAFSLVVTEIDFELLIGWLNFTNTTVHTQYIRVLKISKFRFCNGKMAKE